MDDPYKGANGYNDSDHKRTKQDVHYFVLFLLPFYFPGGFFIFPNRIIDLRP
jgi:hypothetical protein